MGVEVSIYFGYKYISNLNYERKVKEVEKIFDYNSIPKEKDE